MRIYSFATAFAILFLAVCMIPSLAHAQERNLHPSLKMFEEEGYQVNFLGRAYGLDGWVIRDSEGRVQYGYSTPEGGLIMGLLIGPEGELHTAKQVKEMRDIIKGESQSAAPIAKKAENQENLSKSEVVYAAVEDANWFSVGSNDVPYIYTFVNPTCTDCIEFWSKHLKSVVDNEQLQVRFVPFGSSQEDKDISARLLQSDVAGLAWDAYASGNAEGYDILPEDVTEDGRSMVEANNQVFNRWRFPSIPFTIYRAPSDSTVKVMTGVPSNLMMLLADMVK